MQLCPLSENFREEVRQADPKIRKRALQALFNDMRIHPKKGNPWERLIEVGGQKSPSLGANAASPRVLPVYPSFYVKLRQHFNSVEFYPSRKHEKPMVVFARSVSI
jgi:hypothetical protein